MIELAKLTGNIVDNMVEVDIGRDVIRLCTPVFAFPLIAMPYKEWLTAYKDKFLAIISYQEGNMEKPLFLGLKPILDNNFPVETFDQNAFIVSKEFRVWINDKDKKITIDIIGSGKIMLGNKDVTEHAVLGDTAKDWLKDISDKLADLCLEVSKITVPTPSGPSGVPVNLPAIIKIQTAVKSLQQAPLNKILSKSVLLK